MVQRHAVKLTEVEQNKPNKLSIEKTYLASHFATHKWNISLVGPVGPCKQYSKPCFLCISDHRLLYTATDAPFSASKSEVAD